MGLLFLLINLHYGKYKISKIYFEYLYFECSLYFTFYLYNKNSGPSSKLEIFSDISHWFNTIHINVFFSIHAGCKPFLH
jgi:hypothetical protein